MARRPRRDEPGSLHHVCNRGVSKRTMFENRPDYRYFLSQLARAVHRKEIEVLAYSILANHFHVLLRSLGFLGKAMGTIQSNFSRRFNRSRDRDGPLTKNRYWSRRVESEAESRVVISYIDYNPVRAGLVAHPADYEFGSARDFHVGPIRVWLNRDGVAGFMADPYRQDRRGCPQYQDAVGKVPHEYHEIIQRRFDSPHHSEESVHDLLATSPDHVIAWMRRRAALADGTKPGLPVAPKMLVVRWLQASRTEVDELALTLGIPKHLLWRALNCGLLRLLCGLRHDEISSLEGFKGSVSRGLSLHRLTLLREPMYAECCGRIVASILGEMERAVLGR
ncbi:MAG: hypothetical protein V3W41_10390 [Planctomycetota bacterium]